MSVLVVVAHPDDEVLGAGGTIARLTDQGEEVNVLILGKSRVPREHIAKANMHLRSRDYQLNYRDQRFDVEPLLTIIQEIERNIAAPRPTTVYTHHPGDLNLDHQITARAVLTACRPVNNSPVKTIYAMEIPSSTEWGDGSFHPNTYVDIQATLERKVEAMEMYETEARPYPHPRSPQGLRVRAHVRGSESGLPAAEAFQLIRQIHP